LYKTHGQRYAELHRIYEARLHEKNTGAVAALKEMNDIIKFAADHHDEDLLLEAKVYIAHYKWYSGEPREKVLDYFNALLETGERTHKKWLQARVGELLALYCRDVKLYEQAFELFGRMYALIKDMSEEEFPEKQLAITCFANELYKFKDYETAIFYFRKSLAESLRKTVTASFSPLNSIGLCYRELGLLDSSSYYFNRVHELAILQKDEQWTGISGGNLGYNFFLQKKYDLAKPLLQKDADISIAIDLDSEIGLAATALMTLAQISLEEKDLKKFEEQITEARGYTYRSKQYYRLADFYPLYAKLWLTKGDTKRAGMFLDSAIFVKDSLTREFNHIYVAKARQKFELERHRKTVAEINHREEVRTRQRNALIVIIILALIVAFFIYDRQKRKYKLKNEQLSRAREQLEQAARELNSFTRSVSEKNKLIEDLQQQVGDPDIEAIRQLERSTILTDEQWNDFKDLFDKVNIGYLFRLKEKLPGLTPAETRFVALSKLKLSTKEMAAILGIGHDSTRKIRSRLRKKLNLAEEDDLQELLEKI
jgi:tetratricopeptide (TPR) repeat protein